MSTWLIAALALTMLAAVLLVLWLRRRARRHAVAEHWAGSSAGPPATYQPRAWPSPQSAPERHLGGDSDELVLVPVPIVVGTSEVTRPEPVPELEPAGGGFGGAGASGSWDDDDAKRGIASDVSAGICDAEPAAESSWSDSGGSGDASYDSSSSDTSSSWDSGSSGSNFSSDP